MTSKTKENKELKDKVAKIQRNQTLLHIHIPHMSCENKGEKKRRAGTVLLTSSRKGVKAEENAATTMLHNSDGEESRMDEAHPRWQSQG